MSDSYVQNKIMTRADIDFVDLSPYFVSLPLEGDSFPFSCIDEMCAAPS
jgi:hypothetical protein